MIFYFSGTGNSLYAAKKIAKENNEQLVSIAAAMNTKGAVFEHTLKDNERIGFVYPIYAWAPPKMVIDFINKLKFNNYKDNYIFTVATCGENIGNTMKLLSNALRGRGLKLNSGFSVKMPSNYIIMGNVEPKDKEQEKLLAAEKELEEISKFIAERKSGVYKVDKGFMPFVLTSLINPLFNKNAMRTKKFYANDNCNSCGLCQTVCNCQTIKVKDKPTWGENCSQCLACIHICPTKAIQYGKGTEDKGRYRNPNVSVSEMKIV